MLRKGEQHLQMPGVKSTFQTPTTSNAAPLEHMMEGGGIKKIA